MCDFRKIVQHQTKANNKSRSETWCAILICINMLNYVHTASADQKAIQTVKNCLIWNRHKQIMIIYGQRNCTQRLRLRCISVITNYTARAMIWETGRSVRLYDQITSIHSTIIILHPVSTAAVLVVVLFLIWRYRWDQEDSVGCGGWSYHDVVMDVNCTETNNSNNNKKQPTVDKTKNDKKNDETILTTT